MEIELTHPTFTDPSLRITPATPDQATAMEAIFAKRMASSLITFDGIELSDDAACADRLAACGFDDGLITALLHDAQAIAVERIAA